jgi:paraquat-inducible protein A
MTTPSAIHPELVVCDGCTAVYRRPALASGELARCRRCGSPLGRGHALSLEAQLALAIAALVVFLIANLTTIVELNLRGLYTRSTLLNAVRVTWETEQPLIAALAFATAFAFPLAVIALRLYVLAPLAAGWRPPAFALAMRMLRLVTRWSMVEVFMLGTLIALVRSADLADATPGAGIFAFGALAILLTAHQAAGLHGIWRRASELRA